MKLTKVASAFLALSVGFSVNAMANDRFVIQVDNNNKGLVKALAKKVGGNINIEGDGFFAATFSGKDLAQVKGLLNNPHIKLVEVDQLRSLQSFSDDAGDPMQTQVTPYAIYQSAVNQVDFNANAGMKVCIIDSGLDRSNTDFNWNNISGDNDAGTGNWDEHGGPHGTHVAGTVGAADNNIGVVGMAPGVDMHIIKVFNADGWGYSSDLAKAAQLCSAAGSNIISMSLGGGGASSTEENAFNSFSDAGGLVVAAAGNDGNSVRSYPAGYPSVMMVGANDSNNAIADFSQFPSCETGRGKNVRTDPAICVEITAGGVDTLSTYPAGLAPVAELTFDGQVFASSAMENFGDVSGSTYYMGTAETIDTAANGNVCVIDRGVISFHDKVANCENSGGVGAVIINNEAGMLYGTLGDTNSTSIPAVGAALEDRAALLAASSGSISVMGADYGLMSGTSMATPAVSGIAARVWSNHNGCSGAEIRHALNVTAIDSGAAGNDVYFGNGIINAKAAHDYLLANGCAADNPAGLTLTVNGYRSKGVRYVDLNFAGASGDSVDIYRDANLIQTVTNSSSYTDSVPSAGSYSYQVCDAGTSTCSTEQTVSF